MNRTLYVVAALFGGMGVGLLALKRGNPISFLVASLIVWIGAAFVWFLVIGGSRLLAQWAKRKE